MEQIEEGWARTCPQCLKLVVHKTKDKCRFSEKRNKACSTCNRSNVGAANARVDVCPMCEISLKLSRTMKGKSTLFDHAASHGMTAEQLYMAKHGIGSPSTCRCGCGEATAFKGWWEGFSAFVIGHNARVESDDNKEARIAALRESFSSGKKIGWSKGLTKETDERVMVRAQATSAGRKEAFDAGEIAAWSKGLTKETDERVRAAAEALANGFASGALTPWAKGKTKNTDARVAAMAARVSISHQNAALRERLDDAKRLTIEEIRTRVERNSNLSFVRLKGEYVNYLQQNIVVSCNTCGEMWDDCVKRLDSCRCFKCDPTGSRAQSEISDWLRSFRGNVSTNNRTKIGGLELDVYDEDARFAIEYNGHYWHNITKKSSMYHQMKSSRCVEAGIRLFHIFEDEWRDKKPIVQSMIKHRLGVSGRNLNARDCDLKVLSPIERKAFFDSNHIDGDVKSSVAFGLVLDGEVVSAMSLRAPFHKRYSSHTEVARTCSVLGANVRGAVSKLTKAVVAHCAKTDRPRLMTYVDTRFSASTSSWSAAGWSYDSETAVRWWWTDMHERFNRFKYRADAKNSLTEDQVAERAGVVKIYGCKNLLYVINDVAS